MISSRSLARLARPVSLSPCSSVTTRCLYSTHSARLASFQPYRLTPSAIDNAASLSSVDAAKLAKENHHQNASVSANRQTTLPPTFSPQQVKTQPQTSLPVRNNGGTDMQSQPVHATPVSHSESPKLSASSPMNLPTTPLASSTTTATKAPVSNPISPSPDLSTGKKETPSFQPQPRKSRLRTPRKAAIKLTPAAVEQLRDLLDQPEPKFIRVGVRNRGCSGLAYHLEYVDKPGAFDEKVEQDGVMVLIDSKALFSIIGSEMDWVEDNLLEKFVFKNPNIKDQCGCGESFMV
ncbi:hypothetical protein BROUX41_003349 [Berkeleyomyces rouxiae]